MLKFNDSTSVGSNETGWVMWLAMRHLKIPCCQLDKWDWENTCSVTTEDRIMMTPSNGNIFLVTGLLWGEFTGHGRIPSHRPVTRSFDVYFDQRPNNRLSKPSRRRWFETPLCSLWRHCADWLQINILVAQFPMFMHCCLAKTFKRMLWQLYDSFNILKSTRDLA